jgi:16S rRNA (cytidine1402-2'-O)-methyltransferase
VKADFSSVLAAAQSAAGAQHYPSAALYMVATPIGNLADISLRALHLLAMADQIACEDTRHTQGMLGVYGVSKPLLAVHQHNEREAAQAVLARLQAGQRIAYVSDAGTPAVSDPGARLAAAVHEAGFRVLPLPGASCITALISAAGLTGDAGGFVFEGFLATKAQERAAQVQRLAQELRTVILLEAPHRMPMLCAALAVLGQRRVTLGRELTKQFEQIVTVQADQLTSWLVQDARHSSGEFALALHPQTTAPIQASQGQRVLMMLLAELPTKTAVKLAAEITGAPRNALYEAALQFQREHNSRQG